MPRKLVRIKTENFEGYGCSECPWAFNPAGALVGESLEEMTRLSEVQRDKEFAVHVCIERPKDKIKNP